ncbi:RND family efflux transporter MFP subunit [Tolypothrix sp. NIES-4075]|uniref:efflux RND transporter periplasmic adaptor subunit n=1 Tax=Tolypothrix sp. NIES-4075 TaxID=2005459 RepID=UPI000B5C9281|nr:efflux RND transporter periplasmic adaptor subunit [Tolypothrix sp. NIES-4075]GAX42430.1 RND family efflux transporter MFP subunit [Tolypothrix sp. NIES-4075]
MNHEIPKESLIENNIEPTLPGSPKRISLVILGVMLLAGFGFFSIHAGAAKPDREGRSGRKGLQVTPVTVAMVMQKTVPVQLQAIGNVQPASTVSITPQAGGRITGVYFKKGQEVKKGQLLFTLDDRTQNAAIQQAQGTLAKDQALVQQARATLAKDQGQIEQARATLAKDQGQVEQARATLAKDQGLVRQAQATLAKDAAQAKYAQAQSNRYGELYKQGAISQDQAQQYITNNGVSVATLQSDREAIANAQAVVRGDQVAISNAQEVVKGDIVAISNAQAVVTGDRAGIKNAEAVVSSDQGALSNVAVQSTYTKIYAPISGRAGNILVTQGNVVQANSTNPLVTIAQIRPIQVSFSVPESNLPEVQKYTNNGKLKVDVTFSGNNTPIPGVLTFVNNTVDNSTGTIQLIGDFDNAQGNLFPGQYVNTTLTLTQEPNATVVPTQAVQNGPNGQFVFVVKPDMTVENAPVTVSSTIDGLAVVQKGVQPGAQVVTDGQANLVTGSKIRIKTASNSGTDNSSNSGKHRSSGSKSAGGDS